jgi:hypothetical protein
MRNFFIALTRDPISLLGAAITTASALVFAALFSFDLVGLEGGPYVGILSYVIVPGCFVFGLLLIPVGIWRHRRLAGRAALRGLPPPTFPVIDLNQTRTRGMVLTFLALTGMNTVILATATYKGVEVMDSTPFCGTTCHTVMQPEYTAYQRSPHARVHCVSCHIGPGGSWFVKSKLSGAWQLVAVAFNLHPRPIPTPIRNLRPARETCEQCHWPTKFVGDRLRVITHHSDDQASTPLRTVLLLRVGGMQGRKSHGIHWHVDPDVAIRYRADEKRETIHEVELTLPGGLVRRYSAKGPPAEGGGGVTGGEWRLMDCVDCHNRPTHVYRTPEQEVDEALAQGRIDRTLPYARREAVRALRAGYDSHEEARAGIAAAFASFYEKERPEIVRSSRPAIDQAGRLLGDLYCLNVFPKMKVGWGTYPNHLGHTTSTGCFRCHDGSHATPEGQVISQECDTCHTMLAMEEENPEVLKTLQP